jgi:hypothetical protein
MTTRIPARFLHTGPMPTETDTTSVNARPQPSARQRTGRDDGLTG